MIPKSDDIRMEVSTICSYNCTICPHDRMNRPKTVMKITDFLVYMGKIQQETDQYNHVTFSGIGEPLFDPTLGQKLQYVHSLGMKTTIVTNGSKLTPDYFDQLSEIGVGTIRISILGLLEYGKSHGVDEEILQEILSNIDYITKQETDTKLAINCVAENDAELELALKIFECQVDQLEIWKAHNWGSGFKIRETQRDLKKNCGRIFQGPLQVMVDGGITTCCFDYDGKLNMGNLNQSSLTEIFQSAEYVNQVCHSNTGNWRGTGYPCEKCDQRNKNKDGVLLYTSREEEDRIDRTSTSFAKITKGE